MDREAADAFHVAPQQVAAAWWDGLGTDAPAQLPVIHAGRAAEMASTVSAGTRRHAA